MDLPTLPQSLLFNAGALIGLATQSTGLDDFGEEAITESMQRLLDSLRDEASLTPQGTQNEHLRLLKSLTDRLQIQATIKSHPEILDESIERPLIITGLMRTGSTKLQRVISMDPRWHHLPLWEAINPVPFPGETAGDPTARIEMTRTMMNMIRTAFPQAHAGHPMFAEAAEEETFCSQFLIQSLGCFGFARLPAYMDWAIQQPRPGPYRWLRTTLQYLQWQRCVQGDETRKRWLLKSPFHIGYLADLYQVFPDATLVQTHRAPLTDVVASCAMLIHQHRLMGSSPGDKPAEGREVLGYLSRFMKRHMAWRRLETDNRILDIAYRDTIRDCLAQIRRIYAHAGMPFNDEVAANVVRWEAENPQHASGRFEYSAEEFGLDEAAVAQAFAGYADWLNEFGAG